MTILDRSLCCLVFLSFVNATQAQTIAEPVHFGTHVAPILVDHCIACHCAKKSEGGYRLDTYRDFMNPGDSSDSPILPKQAGESEVMKRIMSSDPAYRMPPDSESLRTEQIDTIKNWIDQGAAFDGREPQALLSLTIPPKRFPPPPQTYPAVPATAVVFAPDGKAVYCGGYHEVTVWDASDFRLIRRIENLCQRIYSIAISPDGSLLAVACGEPGRFGEVRVVQISTGEITSVLARSNDVALDVAFRPNSDEIVVASADNSVRIINYKTNASVRTLSSHADWVTAISLSPDGKRLASTSRDKSAKVFDLESGQLLSNYTGHNAPVRGIVFTPDGNQLLTVGDDKKLHRWNAVDGAKTAEIGIMGDGFRLLRTDNAVLIPTSAKKVLKFDLASNKISQSFEGHEDWVLSVTINSEGKVLGGGHNGELRMWGADGILVGRWIATPTKDQ